MVDLKKVLRVVVIILAIIYLVSWGVYLSGVNKRMKNLELKVSLTNREVSALKVIPTPIPTPTQAIKKGVKNYVPIQLRP